MVMAGGGHAAGTFAKITVVAGAGCLWRCLIAQLRLEVFVGGFHTAAALFDLYLRCSGGDGGENRK